jgi:hypothetical protein
MPLSERVAQRRAQEAATQPTLRRNPEIDAKLDRFIGENPKLREYYDALPKEELIRKLMLGKMQQREYAEGRNNEIRSWVEEHPEVKQRIEDRIRNVPAANRERAFINAAKQEAMNQAVRGNGVRA